MNYDFIEQHHISWVDNLITGSGKNLASPHHPDHEKPYAQEYISEYGIRKVEANALVTMPDVARELIKTVIHSYLGDGAERRFRQKRHQVVMEIEDFRQQSGLDDVLQQILN